MTNDLTKEDKQVLATALSDGKIYFSKSEYISPEGLA